PGEQEAARVAEVKTTGRTRCESSDGGGEARARFTHRSRARARSLALEKKRDGGREVLRRLLRILPPGRSALFTLAPSRHPSRSRATRASSDNGRACTARSSARRGTRPARW